MRGTLRVQIMRTILFGFLSLPHTFRAFSYDQYLGASQQLIDTGFISPATNALVPNFPSTSNILYSSSIATGFNPNNVAQLYQQQNLVNVRNKPRKNGPKKIFSWLGSKIHKMFPKRPNKSRHRLRQGQIQQLGVQGGSTYVNQNVNPLVVSQPPLTVHHFHVPQDSSFSNGVVHLYADSNAHNFQPASLTEQYYKISSTMSTPYYNMARRKDDNIEVLQSKLVSYENEILSPTGQTLYATTTSPPVQSQIRSSQPVPKVPYYHGPGYANTGYRDPFAPRGPKIHYYEPEIYDAPIVESNAVPSAALSHYAELKNRPVPAVPKQRSPTIESVYPLGEKSPFRAPLFPDALFPLETENLKHPEKAFIAPPSHHQSFQQDTQQVDLSDLLNAHSHRKSEVTQNIDLSSIFGEGSPSELKGFHSFGEAVKAVTERPRKKSHRKTPVQAVPGMPGVKILSRRTEGTSPVLEIVADANAPTYDGHPFDVNQLVSMVEPGAQVISQKAESSPTHMASSPTKSVSSGKTLQQLKFPNFHLVISNFSKLTVLGDQTGLYNFHNNGQLNDTDFEKQDAKNTQPRTEKSKLVYYVRPIQKPDTVRPNSWNKNIDNKNDIPTITNGHNEPASIMKTYAKNYPYSSYVTKTSKLM